ncbi:putative ribonuclease H-like domain-containing protein [Tanacetum coccineum]
MEANTQKPKQSYEISLTEIKLSLGLELNDEISSKVQTVSPVKTNETQTVKTRVDKIGQTSQKQGIGFKKIKAWFVCKSTDHLIKDCNFYDKQSQEPKLKTMVNTGPRVDKPVWDNTKRVNHQKFSKYPHLRKTFVPSGVLTRTGLITPVKQNEKRAVHKVSTARGPVSTARPTKRPYHTIKGSYYTKPTLRPKDLKQDVKTFRVQNMTTAGTRAVVNTGKAYLSDYEDYNGGFMAFGSDPKGGKITGKGKIRTANLDFDDVYFVDELKFNLFSVSQMCDKKLVSFFLKTECLILSPNSFKLLMKVQVVLRLLERKMLQLRLKEIVLSGGHLVRSLPSKVFVNDHTGVACKKGKQHKASYKAKLERIIRKPLELLHMDLFGPVSVESINKKSAFLYGTIEEEVYVHQPRGFVDLAHPNKVYKVIKALYGLHQAPRAWYETLSSFLIENGFRRGPIRNLFEQRIAAMMGYRGGSGG